MVGTPPSNFKMKFSGLRLLPPLTIGQKKPRSVFSGSPPYLALPPSSWSFECPGVSPGTRRVHSNTKTPLFAPTSEGS